MVVVVVVVVVFCHGLTKVHGRLAVNYTARRQHVREIHRLAGVFETLVRRDRVKHKNNTLSLAANL